MPKPPPILSIVIPCFNEEKNLPLFFFRFIEVIEDDSLEVIIVNNGSTDNSAKILDKLLPKYSFARLVNVEVNQGYGFGILAGLKEAKGKYLGWTHADMQTDPYDTIRALEIIKQSKETKLFIKGKRINRPIFDKFFTLGMSIFESIFLGMNLFEINAQPTIFSREFYESWKNAPFDFSLDLYAYALAKRYKISIKRFPVEFLKRLNGSSSWNNGIYSKYKLIRRTLNFSCKLRKEIKKSSLSLPHFIAHRINTIEELKKTPFHYGVELDLRDRDDGKLIINHDAFAAGEDFEEYLKHYHHGTMILNIKSERIEHRVLELIKKYEVKDYFFLDSSYPMINLLSSEGEHNLAVRFSEFEGLDTVLANKNKVKWVWVDCFTKLPIDREIFDTLKNAGLKMCLVSPELQGRPEDLERYKKYLKNEGVFFDAICTKNYNVNRWI